jgi:small subunit ribosomal protein S6
VQNYTLTVLVKEKLSESDRTGIFDALKKNFGSLGKEDLWGIRSLAYPIKHNDRAFYAHFEFSAEPSAILTLDKNIRLNEDIIRYLLVKVEEKRKKAKPVKKEAAVEEKIEDKETKEKVKEEGKAKKNK